jgi:N-dimethylarginine dimethylaminohydrolase
MDFSKEELLDFIDGFIHNSDFGSRSQAMLQVIRRLIENMDNKVEVDEEDIFNFQSNLMTISENGDDYVIQGERQLKYIKGWLREHGVRVKEAADEEEG